MSSAAQRKHRSAQPHSRRRGAQQGNRNARKHGGYAAATLTITPPNAKRDTLTIIDLIADLEARQMEILQYAKAAAEADQPEAAIKAMAIYGQNASRLARMIEKTGGAKGQSLTEALHAALDDAQKAIDEQLRLAA